MNTKNGNFKNTHRWLIAVGILLISLGILAIVTFPTILSILAIASKSLALRSMTVLLSWTFLIAGIFRLYLAIQTRRARGFCLELVLSILHVTVSILLLKGIIGSIFSFPLALGISIFFEGVFEVFLAFQLRRKFSWNWLLLLKGITTIIVGISIWSEKPFNALGILVLLPGIILVATGIWTVMFSTMSALQLDTPSLSLAKQNKVLLTPNLHKSY